jgi:hypothetical protein
MPCVRPLVLHSGSNTRPRRGARNGKHHACNPSATRAKPDRDHRVAYGAVLSRSVLGVAAKQVEQLADRGRQPGPGAARPPWSRWCGRAAEFAFEFADGLAQRGLRDVQVLSGAPQGAVLADGGYRCCWWPASGTWPSSPSSRSARHCSNAPCATCRAGRASGSRSRTRWRREPDAQRPAHGASRRGDQKVRIESPPQGCRRHTDDRRHPCGGDHALP